MAVAARIVGALVVGLVVGCVDPANGDDPLAALDSTTVTTRYMEPYWREQMKLESPAWVQAVQICDAPKTTERPNCTFVHAAKYWAGTERPPRYDPGTGFDSSSVPYPEPPAVAK